MKRRLAVLRGLRFKQLKDGLCLPRPGKRGRRSLWLFGFHAAAAWSASFTSLVGHGRFSLALRPTKNALRRCERIPAGELGKAKPCAAFHQMRLCDELSQADNCYGRRNLRAELPPLVPEFGSAFQKSRYLYSQNECVVCSVAVFNLFIDIKASTWSLVKFRWMLAHIVFFV